MNQEIAIPVIALGTIAGAATLLGVLFLTRRPERSDKLHVAKQESTTASA